ncbi:hypothetical protein [Kineosporia babensis]|uniref:Uncharacterized protein n=1 Tax=Kineosporia babensis TaxID=499548 RepID=A0A9X1NGF2_9ACTN|nr:hypothetical protein [Kineosporia babensis]MCD5313565.1 hypothetical protein [Kineosporia babensis]
MTGYERAVMSVPLEFRRLALVEREIGMCMAYLAVLEQGQRSKEATLSDLRVCLQRIQGLVLDGS